MGDNLVKVMYGNHLNELKVLKIENELTEMAALIKTPFFDTAMYKGMILLYDPKGILKYPISYKLEGLNLRGPFLFTGNNEVEQDFKSLNKEQIRFLKHELIKDKEIQEELEMGG